jgi:hypothetical protein
LATECIAIEKRPSRKLADCSISNMPHTEGMSPDIRDFRLPFKPILMLGYPSGQWETDVPCVKTFSYFGCSHRLPR